MSLICFTGAGATGKTTILNEITKKLDLVALPSVVREFFKQKGVSSVADCLSRNKAWQFDFQCKLFDHFLMCIDKIVAKNPRKIVISDRSPFDHYAYCVMANDTPLVKIQELHKKLELFLLKYKSISIFFYFKYPTNWSNEQTDGFRYIPGGINITIDALIYKRLHDNFPIPIYNVPDTSIDERVNFVSKIILQWNGSCD